METTKVEISKDGDSVVITIDGHAETRLYPNGYCHEITQEGDFTKIVIHNKLWETWKQSNKTLTQGQYIATGRGIDIKKVT